jgi:hypothetical protein
MLPASREQYRRLAAVLHAAQKATPHLRVVMIASASHSRSASRTGNASCSSMPI